MKIAFCISGHLRNYAKLKDNFYEFKEYIQQFGAVDTFVSTWNYRNTNNSWSTQHGLNDGNSNTDSITHDLVQNHYQTDSIEILDYDFYDSSYSPLRHDNFSLKIYNWKPDPSIGSGNFGIHNNIIHSTKMFFLIYRSNLLKLNYEYKNNINYDLVFRIRPDMQFFPNEYRKQLVFDAVDTTKIYIPLGHIWTDQFAYGSSLLMNKYANAFMRVSSVYDREIFGDPEAVMKECLLDLIGEHNIIRVPKCGYLLAENPNSHIVYR